MTYKGCWVHIACFLEGRLHDRDSTVTASARAIHAADMLRALRVLCCCKAGSHGPDEQEQNAGSPARGRHLVCGSGGLLPMGQNGQAHPLELCAVQVEQPGAQARPK